MADESQQAPLQVHRFDFTTGSYEPYAPWRSMQQSGMRNGSWNGMMHDGYFRKRLGIMDASIGITINQNGWFFDEWNGQSPSEILFFMMRVIPGTAEQFLFIILTSSECFRYLSGAGTTNVTPIYTLGTISITTGTTGVTGVGTFWQDNGIVAGQLINLPNGSANWYVIDSVNSNTSITLKTTLSTATLVGQSYAIRRTGRVASAHPIEGPGPSTFARVFNGDLYYTYIEGATNPCVVKVENIFGTVPGNPTIIGCDFYDNLSGCDAWSAGVTEIKGLELLQDGRVVIATTEDDGTTIFTSRLRYSSHLDQMIWNTSPGGFSDVTALPGKMNAMKALGPYQALHYDNGIALATPTGQDDPPLNFQVTQGAYVGGSTPKAIVNTPRGQVYLAQNGLVLIFDGSNSTTLTTAMREDSDTALNPYLFHGAYESGRDTVWMWNGSINSTGYAINLMTGMVTYHRTSTQITAAADPLLTSSNRLYLGVPSYDPSGSGTGGVTSALIYMLANSSGQDVVPAFINSQTFPTFAYFTDWMDFGMPGVDKIVDHVVLLAYSSGSSPITITAYRDVNHTEPAPTQTIAFVSQDGSRAYKFYFRPFTSERWRFLISTSILNTAAGWDIRPQQMFIHYRPVAEFEAVARGV